MIFINFYPVEIERSGNTVIFKKGFNSISIDLSDVDRVQADYKMNVLRIEEPGFSAEFNFSDGEELEMITYEFFSDMNVEARE